MKRLSKPLILEIFFVLAVLAIGLFLRLAFINHGLPDFENPDEIDFIGPALNLTFNLPEAIKSGDFSSFKVDYFYGHPQGYTNLLFVSLTVFKEVWQLGSHLLPTTFFSFHDFTKADFFLVSRVITGFLSGLVPLLMYLLARRHFGKKAGLMAGLLGAFSFYFILYSHTASPYTISPLANLLFIYFLLQFWESPNRRNIVAVSVSLGLAAAFNFGSVFFLLPLLLVFGDLFRKKKITTTTAIWGVGSVGLIGTVVFVILSPATLINFPATLAAIRELSFTQKMGCLSQTATFAPWQYFFSQSGSTGTLNILGPASFSEALGLLPSILLFLSLILGLLIKNPKTRLLSLTFLTALILYSTSSGQSLRWLLPFLPLLLIVTAVILSSSIHKNIVLVIFVVVLIGPSLFNNWLYLRALAVPDSREVALDWILGNISKETGIARPTISAPPIWRYGYKYDRSISHPQCNKPGQPLDEATPSSLESYICNPLQPQGQVKYVVVSSSVVRGLLDSKTAALYPNLYNGWRGLYDQIYGFTRVEEVRPSVSAPMTGPIISIYKVPDNFDCRNNKI